MRDVLDALQRRESAGIIDVLPGVRPPKNEIGQEQAANSTSGHTLTCLEVEIIQYKNGDNV